MSLKHKIKLRAGLAAFLLETLGDKLSLPFSEASCIPGLLALSSLYKIFLLLSPILVLILRLIHLGPFHKVPGNYI